METSLKMLIVNFLTPKNKSNMKNAKLSAILGRDVNDGEVLSAEDVAKVTAALPDPTETKSENAASNPKTENQAVDFAAVLKAALEPMNATITKMSERLAVVEGSAGADATVLPKSDKGEEKVSSWLDTENSVNKQIAKDLGELI
jgi:hypothetical protein